MSFHPSAPARVLCLLALGLATTSCESMGDTWSPDTTGISKPVGLNPDDQPLLDKIGATIGEVFSVGDFLSRSMDTDEGIEAVKKARSYQESIEKKGKSKEVASVIEKTEAVYAVPVTTDGGAERGKTQLILIDPATGKPLDDNVYTVPAVADNTLIQVGSVKALFTSVTD